MADVTIDKPATTEAGASFFRQSGWLMMANVGGGMFMWLVHFLSHAVTQEEYGIFGGFLAVIMCIPTLPLQMVVTQQTAKSIALGNHTQLTRMLRVLLVATFLIWVVGAIIVIGKQDALLASWKMANPWALWMTVGTVLLSLWQPLVWGALQGKQNFQWLGWSMILNAVGRLSIAAIAVMLFRAGAAGMLAGVFFGMLLSTLVAAWQSKELWLGPSSGFSWGAFLAQIVPPMIGFAAFQFLFTADTVFVESYFDGKQTGPYVSAGTLSRALMWLVGPLASVMFPRIVQSAARKEKSDLMNIVLLGTFILSALGAISLSLLGPIVVRIVSGQAFVKVASAILPWYAGAMVPLAVANVMLSNLMARGSYRIIAPLSVLAGLYAFALTRYHGSMVMVLQTLAVFNVLLLGLCAFFTWLDKRPPA